MASKELRKLGNGVNSPSNSAKRTPEGSIKILRITLEVVNTTKVIGGQN